MPFVIAPGAVVGAHRAHPAIGVFPGLQPFSRNILKALNSTWAHVEPEDDMG